MARPGVNNGRRRATPFVSANASLIIPPCFAIDSPVAPGTLVEIGWERPVQLLRPFAAGDIVAIVDGVADPVADFTLSPDGFSGFITLTNGGSGGVSLEVRFPWAQSLVIGRDGGIVPPCRQFGVFSI